MYFDLLIKDVKIVDIVNKDIVDGYIAISDGNFILTERGIPDTEIQKLSKEIKEGNGFYAIPGLIDTHMHIESSFVTPWTFSQITVPFGLSTILWDFHEIANVSGIEGIKDIYKKSKNLPINIYLAIPSCVPATDESLETPNFQFTKREIEILAKEEGVVSLGEVMDYKGLTRGNKRLIEIIKKAKEYNLIIDGHVPTLKGKELSLYISYGITSDHTLATPEKIEEELQKGLWVQIQEKSLTKENIAYLKKRGSLERILFVTDDVPPDKLTEGHLLSIVNKAIELGLSPFEVIASSTIRASERLGKSNIGIIAPGREANFFLSPTLSPIKPEYVYFHGKLVAKKGKVLFNYSSTKKDILNKSYIWIKSVEEKDLKFDIENGTYKVNVVSFNSQNSLTGLEEEEIEFRNGLPILSKNLSMVSVMSRNDRYKTTGFVKNLGPERGAIATTYSHDSHPLTIIGKDPQDMIYAGNYIIEKGGGIAAFLQGKLLSFISLPIFGLLALYDGNTIIEKFKELKEVLIDIGIKHKNPTQIITLLTLSVSPLFKIGDKGLIDTEKRRLIPIAKERIL